MTKVIKLSILRKKRYVLNKLLSPTVSILILSLIVTFSIHSNIQSHDLDQYNWGTSEEAFIAFQQEQGYKKLRRVETEEKVTGKRLVSLTYEDIDLQGKTADGTFGFLNDKLVRIFLSFKTNNVNEREKIIDMLRDKYGKAEKELMPANIEYSDNSIGVYFISWKESDRLIQCNLEGKNGISLFLEDKNINLRNNDVNRKYDNITYKGL